LIDGMPSPHLLALGPLLRSTFWETILGASNEPQPVMMEFMI
jgi:hypothetical protein